MKRNKILLELSRDHHHGLLLGWKIKQGLKRNVALDTIADYVVYFSQKALFPHFDEEESQVLAFLYTNDEYYRRTKTEHDEIRNLVASIDQNVLADEILLLDLAEKLEAHIRFEEREMFPYIENTLSPEQLEQMGKLIADQHQPYIEDYPHEFWAR